MVAFAALFLNRGEKLHLTKREDNERIHAVRQISSKQTKKEHNSSRLQLNWDFLETV